MWEKTLWNLDPLSRWLGGNPECIGDSTKCLQERELTQGSLFHLALLLWYTTYCSEPPKFRRCEGVGMVPGEFVEHSHSHFHWRRVSTAPGAAAVLGKVSRQAALGERHPRAAVGNVHRDPLHPPFSPQGQLRHQGCFNSSKHQQALRCAIVLGIHSPVWQEKGVKGAAQYERC